MNLLHMSISRIQALFVLHTQELSEIETTRGASGELDDMLRDWPFVVGLPLTVLLAKGYRGPVREDILTTIE